MSLRLPTATLACLALGLAGCGSSLSRPEPTGQTGPAPSTQASATITATSPAKETPPLAEGANLTLATVLDLAQQGSPNRALFAANQAAAEAAIGQARAWSNPELELTSGRAQARQENEDGERPRTVLGGIALKQRFELPSKRNARIAAAESQRSVINHEHKLDRLELEIAVHTAALAVAAGEARIVQAQRAATLIAEVRTAVERRVQAGEGDRGDLARARAEDATAQLAVRSAQADAESARAALRIWCADRLPARFTLSGILDTPPVPIPLATVQHRAIAQHPRLALVAQRQAALLATLNAEERAWYPDVTVGVSANRETDTNDLGVSLGLDLPLWNRNEAGIAQAQAELARNQALERRELANLQREVLAAWNAYDRECRQIASLTADIVPATQEALRLKLAAFQAGETNVLELLDSRRATLTAEVALGEARERAVQAALALTAACGGNPLTTTNSIPTTSAGAQP